MTEIKSPRTSRSGTKKKLDKLYVPYIVKNYIASAKAGSRSLYNGPISGDWVYDWASIGITMPTILFQFKHAPDQASMLTNLGSAAPLYNGYAVSPGLLPASDPVRGAIFRGPKAGFTVGDGIGTGHATTTTGTYFYYVTNQRLVSDYDGTVATTQRTGYHNNPRNYLAHYFSTPRWIWGSGTGTHIDNSWTDSGSLGLSPGKAYRDGSLVNGSLSTTWPSSSVMFGGTFLGTNWNGSNWFCCDVPIFAWWANPISDANMTSWHAGVMNFLSWSPVSYPGTIESPKTISSGTIPSEG